jgi:hypothetical protein
MPNKLLVDTCARQAIFEAVPKTVCEDLRRASASGNTYWPFNAGSWFAIARCAHIKKMLPKHTTQTVQQTTYGFANTAMAVVPVVDLRFSVVLWTTSLFFLISSVADSLISCWRWALNGRPTAMILCEHCGRVASICLCNFLA